MSGKQVQASAIDNEDGSISMTGPFGPVRIDTAQCDYCDAEFEPARRHVMWDWARGSLYWAEVLWLGPCCAPDEPRQRPVDMYDYDTEWETY